MNPMSTHSWRILCWNVRGLNSDARQWSIKEKVVESQSAIICLQETKLSNCDRALIKKTAHPVLIILLSLPQEGPLVAY